jgi:hypothetical protein
VQKKFSIKFTSATKEIAAGSIDERFGSFDREVDAIGRYDGSESRRKIYRGRVVNHLPLAVLGKDPQTHKINFSILEVEDRLRRNR